MAVPDLRKLALKTTAGALSLTSHLLGRAADALRDRGAGDPQSPPEPAANVSRLPVEHRDEPDEVPVAETKPKRATARISNPKRARAVRKRTAAAAGTGPADVDGATGHGGTPASVKAENTPRDLAAKRTGRQAAPLGARETD